MSESPTPSGTTGQKHTAGAFDIRVIIAGLIGAYGVILTLLGLLDTSEDELTKSGGLNINLWAGIGMLVVAAAFVAWARWRPIVVPDEPETTD